MTDHGCSHTWTAIGDTGWTRCRWCDTRIPPKSDTQVAPSPPRMQEDVPAGTPCGLCGKPRPYPLSHTCKKPVPPVAPDSLVARLNICAWLRQWAEDDLAQSGVPGHNEKTIGYIAAAMIEGQASRIKQLERDFKRVNELRLALISEKYTLKDRLERVKQAADAMRAASTALEVSEAEDDYDAIRAEKDS